MPPIFTDRLQDRQGLVLASAADLGGLPGAFGMAAYLVITGQAVIKRGHRHP